MSRYSLKVLSLLVGIVLLNGCSGSESETKKLDPEQSKSSEEKSVLVECKSSPKEGIKIFNAVIEIFPMSDAVLEKVNKLETQEGFTQIDLPIYAKIKNIEMSGKKSSCIKNTLFYGERSLETLSSKYELKLSPISESCMFTFFAMLHPTSTEPTLLQLDTKESKAEDPFVSTCRMVKKI